MTVHDHSRIAPFGNPRILTLTYSSPWLIAVSHVLLRLPVPRHSPCALVSLTIEISFGSLLSNYLLYSQINRLFFLFTLFSLIVVLLPDSFKKTWVSFPVVINYLAIFLYSVFKVQIDNRLGYLVGLSGLEPPTSRLSGGRSNQLSYKPISSGL